MGSRNSLRHEICGNCTVLVQPVPKVLADQEVPGKNIGSNKCTGTSVCRKPEVQILVPVHELSPDFC